MDDRTDSLRDENRHLKAELHTMTVERDFWRDRVTRLTETLDSLTRQLADYQDEGMA